MPLLNPEANKSGLKVGEGQHRKPDCFQQQSQQLQRPRGQGRPEQERWMRVSQIGSHTMTLGPDLVLVEVLKENPLSFLS